MQFLPVFQHFNAIIVKNGLFDPRFAHLEVPLCPKWSFKLLPTIRRCLYIKLLSVKFHWINCVGVIMRLLSKKGILTPGIGPFWAIYPHLLYFLTCIMKIRASAGVPMKNNDMSRLIYLFVCFYLDWSVFLFCGHFNNDPHLNPKWQNFGKKYFP